MYAMVVTQPEIAHAVGVCTSPSDNIGMQLSMYIDIWWELPTKALASSLARTRTQYSRLHWLELCRLCRQLKVDDRISLQIRQWSNIMEVETLGVHDHLDDWGRMDNRKPTTNYFFWFGIGAISWMSKLQEHNGPIVIHVTKKPSSLHISHNVFYVAES